MSLSGTTILSIACYCSVFSYHFQHCSNYLHFFVHCILCYCFVFIIPNIAVIICTFATSSHSKMKATLSNFLNSSANSSVLKPNIVNHQAIFTQTNTGTVSMATLGKLLSDRVECIWTFLSLSLIHI